MIFFNLYDIMNIIIIFTNILIRVFIITNIFIRVNMFFRRIYMPNFSDRLKELRKLKGMTQKQMATQFEMTERNYQRLEANNSPSNETLIKFADYFDVSTDYLLGRSNNPTRY